MSWDVDMVASDGQVLGCEPFEDGGTYAMGGTDQCSLNVTYNYVQHFHFGELDGLTGEQAEALLDVAVHELGTVRDDDYWKATPGNAGAACARLLAWARAYPQGRFVVV